LDDAFSLTMPLFEIVARSTVGYLVMVFLVRVIPSRNAGHISPNDMLTAIVVGTLGASAILGESSSVADIVLMIALVLGWSYVLDLLEYRVPGLRGLFRHHRTLLVEEGRFVKRNMRTELVTEQELMASLRKQGVEDIASVKCAFMEADGEISVIPAEQPARG
jgi:uncharacterized membrane protein YcaP (DUF421 family)